MDRPESLPTLRVVWKSGAEFLAGFQRKGELGSFLHEVGPDGDLPPWAQPGGLLSVILCFVDRSAEFHVHARVLERIEGEGRGLRLAFLAEEKDRQELVLACAEGESLPYFRRRHPRIPCSLAAELTGPDGARQKATATGISEGGAWLALTEAIQPGTVVGLMIVFGELRVPLRGRVTSQVRSGMDPGVGIELLFESSEQRSLVEGCVQALREGQSS